MLELKVHVLAQLTLSWNFSVCRLYCRCVMAIYLLSARQTCLLPVDRNVVFPSVRFIMLKFYPNDLNDPNNPDQNDPSDPSDPNDRKLCRRLTICYISNLHVFSYIFIWHWKIPHWLEFFLMHLKYYCVHNANEERIDILIM